MAAMKKPINDREASILERLGERLISDDPNRVATYRFEVDVITQLKRVFYFSRRIARVAVPDTEQAKLGSEPDGHRSGSKLA